jgi:hypothetical protein
MTYERMKDSKPQDFKRACGVHPQTFEAMLQALRAPAPQQVKPGRPPTLSLEHQLLMPLQYWREYRTDFQIGLSWGVAEAVVCRTVQKIENLLLQSKACHGPGKKKLRAGGTPLAVLVVDVAASPVERPQQNSGNPTVGRRNGTPRKRRSSSHPRRAKSAGSQ